MEEGRAHATILRHATSTANRHHSNEESDALFVAAARKRMAAFSGVVCVAYAICVLIELPLLLYFSKTGVPLIKLIANTSAVLFTGLVFWALRQKVLSFAWATRLAFLTVFLIGANEAIQALRFFEWPSAWVESGAIYARAPAHALLEGLPWTCLLLLVYPPFLPGKPHQHFLLGLATTAQLFALAGVWSLVSGATFSAIIAPSIIGDTAVCLALSAAMSTSIYRAGRALRRERQRSKELGSYELVRQLGQGGMGEVWVARHKMLARPAALKLIKPERIQGSTDRVSQVLKRFEREAHATALLRSTHTVEVYDFGRTEGGDFYYAMELLDGLDLDALVARDGPQPESRVIDILQQVCLSLDEAHAKGIVHRDIKPANIFLCRQGSELDVVKVLDFGLVAHCTESRVNEESQLTRENDVIGTPAFMAPEMVTSREGVDHRADLYALACVGYWLLTGRLLFEGDTPMALVAAHVHSSPPSPLLPNEGRENANELEALLLRTLAKRPEDRPQSARAFLDALGMIRASSSDWSDESRQTWWRTIPPESRILSRTAAGRAVAQSRERQGSDSAAALNTERTVE